MHLVDDDVTELKAVKKIYSPIHRNIRNRIWNVNLTFLAFINPSERQQFLP